MRESKQCCHLYFLFDFIRPILWKNEIDISTDIVDTSFLLWQGVPSPILPPLMRLYEYETASWIWALERAFYEMAWVPGPALQNTG